MLVFGLCSTSYDQPSNLSDYSLPKCKKSPPPQVKKREMPIFELDSTSDDWQSDPSDKS